jgi:hypothetical protein
VALEAITFGAVYGGRYGYHVMVTPAPGFAQQNLPERVCLLEETRGIVLNPRIGVPDEGGCTIITGQGAQG